MDDRLKARRTRLWNKDPNCRRCGSPTILPEDLAARYGVHPGDLSNVVPAEIIARMATIEHQRSRLNPLRGSDKTESTTLFCRRCNGESNAQEIATLPPGRWAELSNRKLENMPEVPIGSTWRALDSDNIATVLANDVIHFKSEQTHVIFKVASKHYVLQINHFAKLHTRT